MRTILVIIMNLFLFTTVFCQISIPGGFVFGNWSIDDSPYLIEGDITIPENETLVIEPGVVIEFQGHYKLNVF